MIGRDKQLKELIKSTKKIRNNKFGGIYYIYSKQGYGKTVLIKEFNKLVYSKFNTCFMQTDNLLNKDLNPFIFFFKNYFNQSILQLENESIENFENKYSNFLNQVSKLKDKSRFAEMGRIKSIIAGLINISIKDSIYEILTSKDKDLAVKIAISEFFKTLSLLKPLVIIIEDIQWLDNESQKMFKLLIRNIKSYPILIIATGRGKLQILPKIKTDTKINKTEIELLGFKKSEVIQLIKENLGYSVVDKVYKFIIDKTERSPFLIEQLCLYLKENNLIKLKNQKYTFANKVTFSLTDINSIIFSRIDALSEIVYNTLLTSSTMGKSCEPGMISEIVGVMANLSSDGEIKRDSKELYITNKNTIPDHHTTFSEISYILEHTALLSPEHNKKITDKLNQIHKIAAQILKKNYHEDNNVNLAYHYEQIEDQNQALECYIKSGNYSSHRYHFNTAITMYEKALSIVDDEKKDNFKTISSIFTLMGDTYYEKAEYVKALDYYKKAFLKIKNKLDEDHPHIAEILMKIGKVNHKQGEYKEAIKNFESSLRINNKIFGENHPKTAMIYNKIGRIHSLMNNYQESINILKKALNIQIETLGERNLETAISYNDIGIVYDHMGEYDKALKNCNKALTFETENSVKKKLQTAKFYTNIGTVYNNKENKEKALDFLIKPLEFSRKF